MQLVLALSYKITKGTLGRYENVRTVTIELWSATIQSKHTLLYLRVMCAHTMTDAVHLERGLKWDQIRMFERDQALWVNS